MIADRLMLGLGCSEGCEWDRFHKWFTFTRFPGYRTFIEWELTFGPVYVSWWRPTPRVARGEKPWEEKA